jgi:hypothetical protein
MSRHSIEIEFVAPEAEITLEGNCVHDSTGTFRVLTLPDQAIADNVDTLSVLDLEENSRFRE